MNKKQHKIMEGIKKSVGSEFVPCHLRTCKILCQTHRNIFQFIVGSMKV